MKLYRFIFTLKSGEVYSCQPFTTEKEAYECLLMRGYSFPMSAIDKVDKLLLIKLS